MKALCFLIPLLLHITKFICSHHLNVGTVLFTKSHLCKKCWTDSEMKLLTARQVMQGVLPDPDYIDISKTGTITVLLEYFQSCFEVICQSTSRNTQHLMFLALADALGGYLRSYILPLTRHAYYAGHIKYFEARKVYQFYEEIKEFLKTNGAGWAKPRMCTLNCKIRPLKISLKSCDTACSKLYLKDEAEMEVCRSSRISKDSVASTKLPPYPPVQCGCYEKRRLIDIINDLKNRENSISYGDDVNNIAAKIELEGGNIRKIEKIRKYTQRCRDRVQASMVNNTKYIHENGDKLDFNNSSGRFLRKRSLCEKPLRERSRCGGRELIIPLPMLDDPLRPSAIGLPFRIRPIRSLCSPHSICVLVRYYVTVIKCMITKTNNKCDLVNFNAHFQSWLSSNVFPHLNDEEWYPAFGGVLRIEETIKNFGSETTLKCKPTCPDDIGYMFSKGYGFDESDYAGNEECPEVAVSSCRRKENRTYLILGIVIIVVLWIMAFCYCICCHCSSTTCEGESEKHPPLEGGDTKKADLSNSFIVQCLVKFFKRADEEKKILEPAKENINYKTYYGSVTSQAEEADESEHRGKVVSDGYRATRSLSTEIRQRIMNNRDTIVLPAQINRVTAEMPMGFNSFWPFAEFHNDADLGKQYPDGGLKCIFDRKELISKIPRREKEQFRTLWKREKSAVQSSDSCMCISNQNEHLRIECQSRKRKADVLSRSFCSDSLGSGGSQRGVIFLRRSRSVFDCPGSCRYSYTSASSSKSYSSSSQAEDDLSVELFGRTMACHDTLPNKARKEEFKKPKTESETERGSTSYSSSEESFPSVKRVLQ